MTPARETRANGMGQGSRTRPAQGPPRLSAVELAHVELAAVDGRSRWGEGRGKKCISDKCDVTVCGTGGTNSHVFVNKTRGPRASRVAVAVSGVAVASRLVWTLTMT